MTLPADGVYIKGQGLKMDESAVTGESDLMKKSECKDPFLISGTNCTDGTPLLIVLDQL